MFKFEIGQILTDKITGGYGVVTARVEYITGCKSYAIQPTALRDGIMTEAIWIDEIRLFKPTGRIADLELGSAASTITE